MRRNNHPTQQDPQKNPDREDNDREEQDGGIDPDPEEDQPMRVGRRAGVEDDDTEEIDLADEDIDEVSELDEEQDAQKGESSNV